MMHSTERYKARATIARARYEVPLEAKGCQQLVVPDGVVLIGSDAHYWPRPPSTAHRALLQVAREANPAAIILNGDVFDGARVSRWDAASVAERDSLPTVLEELTECQIRLAEIREAAPNALLFWTLGNHDSRFERALMAGAPEFGGVKGSHLKDHFLECWVPCMEVRINSDTNDMVQVKHRDKSGPYAPMLNTRDSGVHSVTGHLHSQKVMPWSNLRGTWYGVDAGMLAPVRGPQFYYYTEGSSRSWRSGFCVLTFHGGEMMAPELVTVVDEPAGLVNWRGERLEV